MLRCRHFALDNNPDLLGRSAETVADNTGQSYSSERCQCSKPIHWSSLTSVDYQPCFDIYLVQIFLSHMRDYLTSIWWSLSSAHATTGCTSSIRCGRSGLGMWDTCSNYGFERGQCIQVGQIRRTIAMQPNRNTQPCMQIQMCLMASKRRYTRHKECQEL